jgi:hypothetical protein
MDAPFGENISDYVGAEPVDISRYVDSPSAIDYETVTGGKVTGNNATGNKASLEGAARRLGDALWGLADRPFADDDHFIAPELTPSDLADLAEDAGADELAAIARAAAEAEADLIETPTKRLYERRLAMMAAVGGSDVTGGGAAARDGTNLKTLVAEYMDELAGALERR